MFIFVAFKDPPELSLTPRRISSDEDLSQEKVQLVNPNSPVRIMLEYIRKKCRLAEKTQFDLCDENGSIKKLFSLPTYAYATHLFEHKKTYYLVVYRMEDRSLVVLPQLNRFNKLYAEIQLKAKKSLVTSEQHYKLSISEPKDGSSSIITGGAKTAQSASSTKVTPSVRSSIRASIMKKKSSVASSAPFRRVE